MKPSQVASALNLLLNVHRPAFIWGPPGIGKSEVVAQVAKKRKVELRDVRLGLLDPTDIKGFPYPDPKKGVMTWLPADFLPTSGKGILFLDEANSAPQAVQAASYQLTLNRRVGNYELPPGWDVIMAGNNDGDRAVTFRMPSALANRLVHIDFEVDHAEFVQHAMANGIHADRIAFLRFRSELLHKFDPNTKSHAFPSPRSWFFADQIAQANGPKDIEYELLKGTVGLDAATQYTAFIRVIKDLPTVDAIRLAPEKIEVPNSPATQHAITTMLSMATTEANYSTFMKYVTRMPKEFQVVYNRDCLLRQPKIQHDAALTAWALENQDVVL